VVVVAVVRCCFFFFFCKRVLLLVAQSCAHSAVVVFVVASRGSDGKSAVRAAASAYGDTLRLRSAPPVFAPLILGAFEAAIIVLLLLLSL
jgi:hypothetical protein